MSDPDIPGDDRSAGMKLAILAQVTLAAKEHTIYLALLEYHKYIVMFNLMVEPNLLFMVKKILEGNDGSNQYPEETSTRRAHTPGFEAERAKQQLLDKLRDQTQGCRCWPGFLIHGYH